MINKLAIASSVRMSNDTGGGEDCVGIGLRFEFWAGF